MPLFSSRRVFINKQYHIFTFIQEKDGSIYCHWPDFKQTKWIICKEATDGLVAIEANLPEEGKFTIHGSGMTGFRKHHGRYDNTILFHGNHLINPDKIQLGIRHLFTAQIPQPSYVPNNSPFLNRKSDYSILASHICPVILTQILQ